MYGMCLVYVPQTILSQRIKSIKRQNIVSFLGMLISIIFEVVLLQVVKSLTACSAFCHYDVSTGRLYDKWDRGTNIDNTDGSYHVYFHLSILSLFDWVSPYVVAIF